MTQYITKQGDTFDSIAFKVLGNRRYTRELMEANPDYLEVIIFSGGIKLNIPEITEETPISDHPPWRE